MSLGIVEALKRLTRQNCTRCTSSDFNGFAPLFPVWTASRSYGQSRSPLERSSEQVGGFNLCKPLRHGSGEVTNRANLGLRRHSDLPGIAKGSGFTPTLSNSRQGYAFTLGLLSSEAFLAVPGWAWTPDAIKPGMLTS